MTFFSFLNDIKDKLRKQCKAQGKNWDIEKKSIIFTLDNARLHCTKFIKYFFWKENIKAIYMPPHSP